MTISIASRGLHVGRLALVGAVAGAVLLAGCGDKKKDEKAATQAAARVNKEELTIHQINLLLSQQRNLRADQSDEASKQILERLIDQELAMQKAGEQKLDRDPRVVQQLDAARREIISRAYFDKVGNGAPKPSEEEIKKYYAENPALFAQRRIYQLRELNIEFDAAQFEAIRAKLAAAKDPNEFVNYLQSNSIKFTGSQAVRAAEQVPMTSLPTLAKMKDGDTMISKTPTGAQVLIMVAARAQPVSEERARPAIEQFLHNERKRKLITDDVKALRAGADIKYLGKFAEGAPVAAPIAPAPTAAEVAASASKALDDAALKSGFGLKDAPATTAREAAPIAEPTAPAAASGAMDAATINKGLGGLK